MPTIKINPKLWTITTVRLDDGRVLSHGNVTDVTVEEWDEIRSRYSRQFGSRHRTFVSAEEEAPEPEALWVRAENLMDLSKPELMDLAADRDLDVAGTKREIADRIVAYESAEDPT